MCRLNSIFLCSGKELTIQALYQHFQHTSLAQRQTKDLNGPPTHKSSSQTDPWQTAQRATQPQRHELVSTVKASNITKLELMTTAKDTDIKSNKQSAQREDILLV